LAKCFFIVTTLNPKVINQYLDELKLTVNSRTLFPFGTIKEPNGGYNKNKVHNFNWYDINGSWERVEIKIEMYDA